jgi:hypothetical protein
MVDVQLLPTATFCCAVLRCGSAPLSTQRRSLWRGGVMWCGAGSITVTGQVVMSGETRTEVGVPRSEELSFAGSEVQWKRASGSGDAKHSVHLLKGDAVEFNIATRAYVFHGFSAALRCRSVGISHFVLTCAVMLRWVGGGVVGRCGLAAVCWWHLQRRASCGERGSVA